jgi:hypothetical protein
MKKTREGKRFLKKFFSRFCCCNSFFIEKPQKQESGQKCNKLNENTQRKKRILKNDYTRPCFLLLLVGVS